MNSITKTQRTITIGYGPGYANSKIWEDLKSKLIIPTEIVSLTAAQRYSPALILLDNHLVIIPFLTNFKSRSHAAISICFGGKPPLALLGRSLL
ncbi:MAG: hypothetical protein EXR84_09980 [Gammaproteobacteria bacterium]|nr:hypothetical protein [Gammaproteobacteria bacterium]